MELDPKQAEGKIDGFWETAVGYVRAHPKTAIAVALAVIVIAIIIF